MEEGDDYEMLRKKSKPTFKNNDGDNYNTEQKLLIKEQKAFDKFLAGNGCCLICFISNPGVLNEHHLAGRKHYWFTITVCANHHAILSQKQTSWPAEWLQPNLPPEKRMALLYRGLSDVFDLLHAETWEEGTKNDTSGSEEEV